MLHKNAITYVKQEYTLIFIYFVIRFGIIRFGSVRIPKLRYSVFRYFTCFGPPLAKLIFNSESRAAHFNFFFGKEKASTHGILVVQNRDCSNFQVVAKFTILKIVAKYPLFQDFQYLALPPTLKKRTTFC